jgi:hypothetical protein
MREKRKLNEKRKYMQGRGFEVLGKNVLKLNINPFKFSVAEPEPKLQPPEPYHSASVRTGTRTVIFAVGSGFSSGSGYINVSYMGLIFKFLKESEKENKINCSKLKSTCSIQFQ